SRRRHTRSKRDWSSDVCSSDLGEAPVESRDRERRRRARGRGRIVTAVADDPTLAEVGAESGVAIGVVTFPGSLDDRDAARAVRQIGRASCREWVWMSEGGGSAE